MRQITYLTVETDKYTNIEQLKKEIDKYCPDCKVYEIEINSDKVFVVKMNDSIDAYEVYRTLDYHFDCNMEIRKNVYILDLKTRETFNLPNSPSIYTESCIESNRYLCFYDSPDKIEGFIDYLIKTKESGDNRLNYYLQIDILEKTITQLNEE